MRAPKHPVGSGGAPRTNARRERAREEASIECLSSGVALGKPQNLKVGQGLRAAAGPETAALQCPNLLEAN